MRTSANHPTMWQRAAERHDRAQKAVLELQVKMILHPSEESASALHAAIGELLGAPKFPAGIDVIRAGECPIGGRVPLACFVCAYGHMTECHYPQRCDEAQCSHELRGASAKAEESREPAHGAGRD